MDELYLKTRSKLQEAIYYAIKMEFTVDLWLEHYKTSLELNEEFNFYLSGFYKTWERSVKLGFIH